MLCTNCWDKTKRNNTRWIVITDISDIRYRSIYCIICFDDFSEIVVIDVRRQCKKRFRWVQQIMFTVSTMELQTCNLLLLPPRAVRTCPLPVFFPIYIRGLSFSNASSNLLQICSRFQEVLRGNLSSAFVYFLVLILGSGNKSLSVVLMVRVLR